MTGLLDRIVNNLKAVFRSALYEANAIPRWESLDVPARTLQRVQSRLIQQLQEKYSPGRLTDNERRTVRQIREITCKHNRNNVTRTEAYRQMYFQFPELHWALLAHLVSRNGGWQMTDLQGDLLPHLLTREETVYFFQSLERANALIFQDAYPQLLLYEESVRQQKNLFHLLPALHVSRFMRPFWDEFWLRKDSRLLTLALIVNEQHYIQKRVAEHPLFRQHVYDTLKFKGQMILQLTHVMFPFYPATPSDNRAVNRQTDRVNAPRLAGFILEDFKSLDERIGIGKNLYAILFGIDEVHRGAVRFARAVAHTGSRADYWPHLFCKTRQPAPRYAKPRLIADKLQTGAPPFYSPELRTAWPDQPLEPPERFDWFSDLSVMRYFAAVPTPGLFDLTDDFCFGLNRLEWAVLAKQRLDRG